jgi:hypothetical protein
MKTLMTDTRRPAGIPGLAPERPNLRDPTDGPKSRGQGGPDRRVAIAPRPADGAAGRPHHPADRTAHQRLVPPETATRSAESDEELVPDPRACLSPSQVVDRRLLALLGSGNPGLYVQASGRPGGIRRQTGE